MCVLLLLVIFIILSYFVVILCLGMFLKFLYSFYENHQKYIFSFSSKIGWINFWHKFLIFIKLKQKQKIPFEMKKYIAKNARFFIQIKLFQCSKQLQKIIKQYRGKQCGRLFVYNLPHLEIDFGAENIYVTGNPSNKYFDKKKPLKVIGGLYLNHYLLKPGDFEMLYPTLDLSELKVLKVSHKITLNSSIFYKYLVETLVEIDLCDVEVENVDIPLAVLKQCPLATKINVPWNKHLTAMSKMAVVERKTKIKEFVIDNISQILHLEDVVNFVKNQMDTNGFICLKNPLKWLPDMTPSVRYYNRHVLNPFIHISSEIFCTFYKDTF